MVSAHPRGYATDYLIMCMCGLCTPPPCLAEIKWHHTQLSHYPDILFYCPIYTYLHHYFYVWFTVTFHASLYKLPVNIHPLYFIYKCYIVISTHCPSLKPQLWDPPVQLPPRVGRYQERVSLNPMHLVSNSRSQQL